MVERTLLALPDIRIAVQVPGYVKKTVRVAAFIGAIALVMLERSKF